MLKKISVLILSLTLFLTLSLGPLFAAANTPVSLRSEGEASPLAFDEAITRAIAAEDAKW